MVLVLLREAARGTDIFALGANTIVEAPRFLGWAVPAVAVAACASSLAQARRAPEPARLVPGMVLLDQVAAFAGGFAWLHYLMLPLLALLRLPAIWPAPRCLAAAALVVLPLSTPVFTRLIDLQTSNTGTIALGAAAFVALWAVFAAAARVARTVARLETAGPETPAAIAADG